VRKRSKRRHDERVKNIIIAKVRVKEWKEKMKKQGLRVHRDQDKQNKYIQSS
jgi:hypothetical protein